MVHRRAVLAGLLAAATPGCAVTAAADDLDGFGRRFARHAESCSVCRAALQDLRAAGEGDEDVPVAGLGLRGRRAAAVRLNRSVEEDG